MVPFFGAPVECCNQGYYLYVIVFLGYVDFIMYRRSFVAIAACALVVPPRMAFAKPRIQHTGVIRPSLLARAMDAFTRHAAQITHKDVIAIADFGLASSEIRFHLLNVTDGRVSSMLVSHGKGSDPGHTGWLKSFSNMPSSNASSQGSYVTGDFYLGKHGRSRRLAGLDPENNLAEERAIVIHAASYVSAEMAAIQGKVGRSQGCFAVSENSIAEVLNRLGPGRLLFADKI
jgi:hypothetical protein